MLLSRKYTLSIKDPCRQSWDKMHPTGKGRFCDSCSSNVVDFTEMTGKEITTYFRNRPANVCGRFRAAQMQNTYVQRPQLRIPFHKRFFSYLLSFFVSNAVINKAIAQTDTVSQVQTDTLQKLAVNDTLVNDSASVVSVDSLPPVNDSLKITWNPDTSWIEFKPVTVQIDWVNLVVMGSVSIPVYVEPSFIDLCKLKVKDSIGKYIKAPVEVAENDLPAPKKAPLKHQAVEVNGILPEEVKRRSEGGS